MTESKIAEYVPYGSSLIDLDPQHPITPPTVFLAWKTWLLPNGDVNRRDWKLLGVYSSLESLKRDCLSMTILGGDVAAQEWTLDDNRLSSNGEIVWWRSWMEDSDE